MDAVHFSFVCSLHCGSNSNCFLFSGIFHCELNYLLKKVTSGSIFNWTPNFLIMLRYLKSKILLQNKSLNGTLLLKQS